MGRESSLSLSPLSFFLKVLAAAQPAAIQTAAELGRPRQPGPVTGHVAQGRGHVPALGSLPCWGRVPGGTLGTGTHMMYSSLFSSVTRMLSPPSFSSWVVTLPRISMSWMKYSSRPHSSRLFSLRGHQDVTPEGGAAARGELCRRECRAPTWSRRWSCRTRGRWTPGPSASGACSASVCRRAA